MGLDTVELVMVFEETFDITIPDRDAEKIQTVGMACDYILARLDVGETAPCLSSAAFYRVRRGLIRTFGVERARVRPTAAVAELGLELPDLIPPEPLRRKIGAIVPIAFLCALASTVVVVWSKQLALALSFGILIGGFVAALLADLWTRSLAVELAPHCLTVRDLVHTLIGLNPTRLIHPGYRWNRAEVRRMVHAIVATQLGVDPEFVTDDANFVRDLGAD